MGPPWLHWGTLTPWHTDSTPSPRRFNSPHSHLRGSSVQGHTFLPQWLCKWSDGLSSQHLKDLVSTSAESEGRALLEALTPFVNLMLCGKTPSSVRSIFFDTSLIALQKKGGGIRSTAIGHTIATFIASPDPSSRAQVLAVATKESGAWLKTLPISSVGLSMEDDVIWVEVGLRLEATLCKPTSAALIKLKWTTQILVGSVANIVRVATPTTLPSMTQSWGPLGRQGYPATWSLLVCSGIHLLLGAYCSDYPAFTCMIF